MAKYSNTTKSAPPTLKKAPIRTTDETTTTYEGDVGFVRDAKSELFSLAVTSMGEGEDTFYESSSERHQRFVGLVGKVTTEDPEWMQQFIPWLRNTAQMRTVTIVALVEYVRTGGPNGRQLIARTLARADEPSEILGYWFAKYGRKQTVPKPIKRGIADAITSGGLYNEYAAMKYDTRAIRLGDVIELVHPTPVSASQSELFRYLLDRRHHPKNILANFEFLPQISSAEKLKEIAPDDRRKYLRTVGADALQDAGMTWERLSEWLPGGMDAEAWEWIIPSMGYMALLRNLRNFDEAGVSQETAKRVIETLTDPEAVAKSRQLPYRFYSAYKNVPSDRWSQPLAEALDLSTQNIPELSGRSLILVDVSGSMCAGVSRHSQIACWEVAALFGVAQFRRANFEGDLVAFASHHKKLPLSKGTSVLKGIGAVQESVGSIGYGTEMWLALSENYDDHDRIFIFTDMQSFGYHNRVAILNNVKCPIYAFDLTGYRATNMAVGENNRYQMGGLTDATFRQIALLEQFQDATWPWETAE